MRKVPYQPEILLTRAKGRELVQLANSRATIALGLHVYQGVDYRLTGLLHL